MLRFSCNFDSFPIKGNVIQNFVEKRVFIKCGKITPRQEERRVSTNTEFNI